METLILGASHCRARQSLAMLRIMGDFHYGMMGVGRTLSTHQYWDAEPLLIYDSIDQWHAVPDTPDTSYAAVQKTPFYNRSVKSGTPSTLLTNLIGRL